MNAELEFVGVQWFENVVRGTQFHGVHGIAYRSECSDEDYGRTLADALDPPKQIKSIHSGHSQIGNDKRRRFLLEGVKPGFAVAGGNNRVTFLLEPKLDQAP